MPEATVLYDAIRYVDEGGNVQSADKGQKVSLSKDEFDRLKTLDAVAVPKSKAAAEASAEAEAEAET